MSIAPTLHRYLAAENIQFELIPHEPTASSTRTAQVCGISGDRIAKAIVLKRDGGFMLAILPASHHIRVADLNRELGGEVEMANEAEIELLFPDCAHGAVPPIGQCYGLALLVDDSIEAQPDVYFEAGDHQTLLHVDHAQFALLMAGARHGHFSNKLSRSMDSSVIWG
jgi:Ala-tRNA(Pro) deacylase